MWRHDWVTLGLALLVLGGTLGCGARALDDEEPVRWLAPSSNAMTAFANGLTFSDHVGVRSFGFAYPSTALSVDTPSATMPVTGSVATYSGVEVAFQAC